MGCLSYLRSSGQFVRLLHNINTYGMNRADWMDSVALSRNLLADNHCTTVSCFYGLHLLNWTDSCYCIANLHTTVLCHAFNCILWITNNKWFISLWTFQPNSNSHTTSQHCCLLFFPLLNERLRVLFCAFQLRRIVEEKAFMTEKNNNSMQSSVITLWSDGYIQTKHMRLHNCERDTNI